MLSAHRATSCVRRSQRRVEERLTLAASGSARTLQDAELRELRRELERLRSENDRLARIVGLVGPRPLPDEAPRSPLFGGFPGAVDHSSSPADKVMFFRHLFAGREDVHALRWENDRTGRAGWMPAVEGGFRRGQTNRTYMPLTDEAITAHLAGSIHAGLYPLMDGDTCRLLACDFDGSLALLDALAYTKAARSFDVPTALEVSRSGVGVHVWTFFTDVVAATTARRVGAGRSSVRRSPSAASWTWTATTGSSPLRISCLPRGRSAT